MRFAKEFSDIPLALAENEHLLGRILELVGREPMPGKATEGGERLDGLRAVLSAFFRGECNLQAAINRVELALPRAGSVHANNNRVFPNGWAERLFRTQVSRFYNQAVLEWSIGQGITKCFVPHSEAEGIDSPCSTHLAGDEHSTEDLLGRLVSAYRDGIFDAKVLKIPNHPHCTHVVVPRN